jgi:hypothetical protein
MFFGYLVRSKKLRSGLDGTKIGLLLLPSLKWDICDIRRASRPRVKSDKYTFHYKSIPKLERATFVDGRAAG